uniref:Fmi1(Pki) n=1 Tax=Arundo donax TaxID=35708 RepID=A0A0A9HRL2_ARUDO
MSICLPHPRTPPWWKADELAPRLRTTCLLTSLSKDSLCIPIE